MKNTLLIRKLKKSSYLPIWQEMQQYTQERSDQSLDQLWLLEHEPVFTQGKAGKAEHVLNPHDIPIVQTDRGGQVTYHGPGQLMAYTLFNLQQLQLNTRDFVCTLEKTIIDFLAHYDIKASGDRNAPGIYVDGAKICSIGLRVRKGFAYHGIALNVDMDLTPFSYINPCGFKNLKMVQIRDFCPQQTLTHVRDAIIPYFIKHFGYTEQITLKEQQHVEPTKI
ncbi:MAG: lipoyl(octanoyl) transferase LipB [Gammaproteobacteria bacterium]|nr:lipoyl(octanoyl) transferase LipB [Gammaproteobacteria bacterium]MCH9744620.1 lipoyl(octanoyl) transferase LipB [Gammaproteobacteria bacterium]